MRFNLALQATSNLYPNHLKPVSEPPQTCIRTTSNLHPNHLKPASEPPQTCIQTTSNLYPNHLKPASEPHCLSTIQTKPKVFVSLKNFLNINHFIELWHPSFVYFFRPKTVHCSTENAYTSEITFLALVPCVCVIFSEPWFRGRLRLGHKINVARPPLVKHLVDE